MANEDTYKNLPKDAKEQAVRTEMLPFFIYAAIPILITITIALIFGPNLV